MYFWVTYVESTERQYQAEVRRIRYLRSNSNVGAFLHVEGPAVQYYEHIHTIHTLPAGLVVRQSTVLALPFLMAEKLALVIVAAARNLEAAFPTPRYASLQFDRKEELPWKAILPRGESQTFSNAGEAVTYFQENGFSITPNAVEKILAKRESHLLHSIDYVLEFIIWNGM